jgi:hypothetical protein
MNFKIEIFSNVSSSYGGELILGGIDSNYYTGSITYVSLLQQTYWLFRVNRFNDLF